MDQIERFKKLLGENNHSVTKPRLNVFGALLAAKEPFTVTELVSRLYKLDKVSVYRTIKLFEEIGVVKRVWSGFKSSVELSEAFSPHHHHFTCVNCSTNIGLVSDALESDLENLETERGFKLTQHSIELKGFCKTCIEQGQIECI